ncbi:MerR family transcriptional regulator [Saccharopolyspora sp. K220]|uniref:MerR family transcriptional regulator n=1 Tax=Saccharopolyspora soli TaxID=2926618 RepID=UPI001F57BF01|nr:MerR family transcriptional regulator [Saccharopolyspora soli]MCI2421994.1 MerR family transcriptional regulator [Saccharopolyspora soli]
MLSIGDFARATHLSVKTLRYYHDAGLLIPAEVDPNSGYRRYDIAQITTAQVIRRFRDLGMPVDDVRAMLQATDLKTRNALIGQHLRRMEDELGKTQAAVATLRDLLDHPASDLPIEHRHLPPMRVAAISDEVASIDVGRWLQGALGELYATASAQGLGVSGVAGGIYGDGLFEDDAGSATVFLPITADLRPMGRVTNMELPAADLAVIAHDGPDDGIDRAYGSLASYVARHALSVPGPIREFYPVNRHHTADARHWRTEIGWPIFPTGGEPAEQRP